MRGAGLADREFFHRFRRRGVHRPVVGFTLRPAVGVALSVGRPWVDDLQALRDIAACVRRIDLREAWKFREIRDAFFQERLFPFAAFLAHVVEQGGVAGEVEQAHLAVAVGIEGGLEAA